MNTIKSRIGWVLLGAVALFPALAPAPQQPQVAAPKIGELKELADARVKVCDRMLDFYRESLKAPPAPGDPVLFPSQRYAAGYEPIHLWSKRRVEALLDGSADLGARVKVLADEVGRIKRISDDLQKIAKDQPEWRVVADTVEFYRLEAEYRLAKEKSSR